MPRKPGTPDHMTLHLQPAEGELVRRIASYFPDGAVSINRVARLCVRAGAPIVEAQMRERAAQYAEAVPQTEPVDDGKEPTP